MAYRLSGTFIEACDCFELCPCWVDDDPDEGHCTGLVAWRIDDGEIEGVDVSGRAVVAVTTHGGRRLPGGADPRLRASTVLFVDDGTGDDQLGALTAAFTATREGALGDLVQVTGRVVGPTQRVPVDLEDEDGGWKITVGPRGAEIVEIAGESLRFDGADEALTLNHTALHRELHIVDAVEAKRSGSMSLNVPALGGSGYVQAKARSGMSGAFCYESR